MGRLRRAKGGKVERETGEYAHLLQVQVESLKSRHRGHMLLLIPLDALDDDEARGQLVGLLLDGRGGLVGLLNGVLRCALLGFDGEGGCRGF